MAELSALSWRFIFGNAYPIQPISSRKPAGTPNNTPIRNRPGAKIGEITAFKQRSTARTTPGGMISARYQFGRHRMRRIRKKGPPIHSFHPQSQLARFLQYLDQATWQGTSAVL